MSLKGVLRLVIHSQQSFQFCELRTKFNKSVFKPWTSCLLKISSTVYSRLKEEHNINFSSPGSINHQIYPLSTFPINNDNLFFQFIRRWDERAWKEKRNSTHGHVHSSWLSQPNEMSKTKWRKESRRRLPSQDLARPTLARSYYPWKRDRGNWQR